MKKIYPLIMCGGTGTRLWPLSRTRSPKQFQKIGGKDSLTFFQAAVQRHRGDLFYDPCIVTSLRHRGTVVNQLREIQSGFSIICEPMGRNTGPAVLAAAHALASRDANAVILVIPADHIIEGDLTPTIEAQVTRSQLDGSSALASRRAAPRPGSVTSWAATRCPACPDCATSRASSRSRPLPRLRR